MRSHQSAVVGEGEGDDVPWLEEGGGVSVSGDHEGKLLNAASARLSASQTSELQLDVLSSAGQGGFKLESSVLECQMLRIRR